MKKWSVFVLLIFTMLQMFAQPNTTKIEEAVFTKGYLYRQEIFSVDNIYAFRIDAIKVTNLEKFNFTSGIRVVQKILFGKKPETITNYIDIEEIEGIITALQYMKTILKNKTIPSSYTEIKYNTTSGFQVMIVTVINEQDKLGWNFMIQSKMAEERTLVNLPISEMDKLYNAFEQAKTKLH